MGARSRTKGVCWEREVARRLSQATGVNWSRNLTETRDGNTGDVHCARLPFSVQCKVGARPPIERAVVEAEESAPAGYYSLAVTRRNVGRGRKPVDIASLPLDDLLELLKLLTDHGILR